VSAVVCVECRASVPASEVELTGNGWRCRKCSLRYQIDLHQGADEQVGQISVEAMRKRASNAMTATVLAILAGILVVILLAAGALRGRNAARALWVVPACIAFAGYELVAWRRARNAVGVMERRETEQQ
jgi:hypothetical protein